MTPLGLLLFSLALLTAAAVAQQQQTSQQATTAPPRSYAQAAGGSGQQRPAPSQQSSGAEPPTPPPRPSGGAGQGVQPPTPPPRPSGAAQPSGAQPPTPPPRGSYAQAAHNNNQQPHATQSTPRPPPRGSPSPRPSLSPAAANVSDDDLRALSEELLRSDSNNAAANVRTNWQGRTHGGNQADLAPAPLLNIAPRVLQTSPTISKLRSLYDNYESDAAVAETITPSETNENAALLDAIVATQVMAKTRRFLIDKNLLASSPGSLRTMLQQLWFTMYPRLGGGSKVGSSAFEHVFLAELRRGEVSGLHNWVFFAAEEGTGKLDYLGYIRRIDLGTRGSIVKHHFCWSNVTKPVGSMFVGTSPELEMALYTACFLARPDERCPVRLAGEPFNIKTHSFTYRGNKYIGSAFPDI